MTGGLNSAIGWAISKALAEEGAIVTATSRDTGGMVMPVNFAGSIEPLAMDVHDPGVWVYNYDILINNAGISAGRSVPRTVEQDWQNVLDTNLSGAWRLTALCVPHMIAQAWGRIVNISSVVGIDGRLGPATYAASKAGLVGLTKATAHEFAHKGITVNAVAPGFIADTGLMAGLPQPRLLEIRKQIPMDRFGTVDDVAGAVLYLLNAPYVTGTVLNVSGGYVT